MKKSSLRSLVAYLNGTTIDNISEIKAELEAELAKGEEKANANRILYDAAHDVVMKHINSKLITVADLFEKCKDELPNGFTRSKMQYAMINYWNNEIVKVVNDKGPNEYRRA